uniref:NADH-ubiquinone oxidoreductase chain 5 n=1 Tax=Microbotryum lychnidis-dioicae TaxID=288795 RepID=M1GLW1_9BASI|nr:NADH dehydrogenase subunit 5 [Microbotryum lychnidis-dioicae]AGE14577.1 NADH dehydrogenase subunit 5 [Microbotryum lychnidis-dioicae]
MYLSILALPLLGSISSGLFGRKLGVTGAQIITCVCMLTSSFLSMVAFYEVALCGSPVSVYLSSWIDSGLMSVDWAFTFDSLTVSMLLPVLFVSSMVHIYSVSYMSTDPHNQRFFAYLSMFTFFMLVLVAGDNYLILFVGWEGIGVSSYLLINFWYTRIQANKSAIKAMVINRVGDTSLSIAFFGAFWAFGNLDYATIYSLSPYMNETVLTVIGLLFLFAAMGKSAQLGLHSWLPDAMEGPTPVSALIHAATLVTAGVYLLLRSSPLLEFAPTTLVVITWVGAITAFFAATTGLLQNDIKRVIAYSTCSQMGYLFMAVGISQYSVALFHLVNHAFFKAVLFLAAGGVLHSMSDQQDMRRLGGLINFLPFTYTIILIGSLSLMAVTFLSGNYSKDLLIELGYGSYTMSGSIVYWLGTITAAITAFYSFRLISMTFLTTPNASKSDYENTHEQDMITVIPLVLLALLSIFFGYVAKDSFVGIGSDMLSSSLFVHPSNVVLVEAEFSIPVFYKFLPLIVTFLGASLSLLMYHTWRKFTVGLPDAQPHFFHLWRKGQGQAAGDAFSGFSKRLYTFFNAKWYFDAIINHYVLSKGLKLGLVTAKVLDRGAVELLGPFGLSKSLSNGSQQIARLDTGVVTQYALYIMIGLISISLLLFVPVLTQEYLGNVGDVVPLALIYIVGLLFISRPSLQSSVIKPLSLDKK